MIILYPILSLIVYMIRCCNLQELDYATSPPGRLTNFILITRKEGRDNKIFSCQLFNQELWIYKFNTKHETSDSLPLIVYLTE